MEPLGLLYIKTALESHGNDVDIYHATASGKVKKIKTPPEFKHLDKYYEKDFSPFSLHNGYKRFGDSFKKIIQFCENGNYDIIGISSLFSAYHPDVEKLASEIKKASRSTLVIGGAAVNSLSETAVKKSAADYMISGCGTVSMPLFVQFLLKNLDASKVPGLIYEKNRQIYRNKPSKDPPWKGNIVPIRESFRTFRKKTVAKTIFSSGCKNKCVFCSIHRENSFEQRGIESIRDELDYLFKAGAEIIDIEDDDIFGSDCYSLKLLDLLEDFHKKGFAFTAMNGLTARNILPIIDKFPKAGFFKLDLSLVTTSQSASEKMKRPHDISDIMEIVKAVKGKMDVEVYLIPGLPGTSLMETAETMKILYKNNIKCGLSPLYPVPGVPLFEKTGIPENLNLCRGTALYTFKNDVRDNIVSLLKISRFLNYSQVAENNDLYRTNLFYFLKSLQRRQWFKKTQDNKWLDSFSFSEKFADIFDDLFLD